VKGTRGENLVPPHAFMVPGSVQPWALSHGPDALTPLRRGRGPHTSPGRQFLQCITQVADDVWKRDSCHAGLKNTATTSPPHSPLSIDDEVAFGT